LRRIYWDAHWQNLALHAVRMGTRLAVQARGAGSVAESPLAVTIVKGLLWPGTVGTGLWYVGEVVFLVSFRPFPMDEAGDLVAFLAWGNSGRSRPLLLPRISQSRGLPARSVRWQREGAFARTVKGRAVPGQQSFPLQSLP